MRVWARRLAEGGKVARDAFDLELAHARLQGNSQRLRQLEQEVRDEADQADHDDPKMICPVSEAPWLSTIMCPMPDTSRSALPTITYVHAQPARGEGSPRWPEHSTDQHAIDMPSPLAPRIGRLDEIAARACDCHVPPSDELEHGADEDHEQLLVSQPIPAHKISSVMKAKPASSARMRRMGSKNAPPRVLPIRMPIGTAKNGRQNEAADDAPDGHAERA